MTDLSDLTNDLGVVPTPPANAINYVVGDATDPQGDGTKVIVHCCNDIGGWGAGFVLALSAKWKSPETAYRENHSALALGDLQLVNVEPDIIVANLIGQHGIKASGGLSPVRYDAIFRGLSTLAQNARYIDSVHMPRMGAGLAGGKWSIIEAIINETLIAAGVPVFVYDLPE